MGVSNEKKRRKLEARRKRLESLQTRTAVDLEHTKEIKRIPDLEKPIHGLMDRKEGRECFVEVHGMLKEIGAPFFLIHGTLLGAYRDNGFVPTEKDIDLGMMASDLAEYAPRIIEGLLKLGYEIRTVNRPYSQPRVINAVKRTVKLDFVGYFPWKRNNGSEVLFCPNPTQNYSIVLDASLFSSLTTIELFGCLCKAPNPIESYLINEYGKDWPVPRNDHKSKTRVENFLSLEKIPNDAF